MPAGGLLGSRLKRSASKRWRIARNGSPYLRLLGDDGGMTFVNRSPDGTRWGITIKRADRVTVHRGLFRYRSEFAAKLAAEEIGRRMLESGKLTRPAA